MPGMDGFDLALQIRSSRDLAGAVILMLTSGTRQDDLARCRELGVSACLTKPVRRAELQAAIISALARNSSAEHFMKAPMKTPLSAAGETATQSPLRILLAEDTLVNQRLAVRILEKEGHRVVVAGNGREALTAWLNQPFDLILMDVQMPEMDGYQATAAIRERESRLGGHLPIVAMTAHALDRDRERCLAAGMDAYLTKPIQIEKLFDLIEQVATTGLLVAKA
jgi:CheY-like chemotaxis protein